MVKLTNQEKKEKEFKEDGVDVNDKFVTLVKCINFNREEAEKLYQKLKKWLSYQVRNTFHREQIIRTKLLWNNEVKFKRATRLYKDEIRLWESKK